MLVKPFDEISVEVELDIPTLAVNGQKETPITLDDLYNTMSIQTTRALAHVAQAARTHNSPPWPWIGITSEKWACSWESGVVTPIESYVLIP